MNNKNEISNLRKGANLSIREYMKQVQNNKMRPRIKNNPSKGNGKKYTGEGKGKKIAAGLAAGLLIITAAGCTIGKQMPTNNGQIPTEYTEKNTNQTMSEEKKIETVNAVKKDFTATYVKAYNEKYNTNYKEADFFVNYLKDSAVYQMEDGNIVTRGTKPGETESKLKKFGNFTIVNNTDYVFQIVDSYSGKILGTYDKNGKFIYSGNQLSDLENKDFIEPELKELGINPDKAKKAAEVVKAQGVEGENSVNARIKSYNNTSFELIDQKEDDITR